VALKGHACFPTLNDISSKTAAPTLLVGVDFGLPHFDAELQELGLLAESGGLKPVARLTCKRKAPDPALFVGSGKADEIKELALMHGAKEVLFDQALSPAQQRNLERHMGLPVNDRTFLSTRLVRRWSHLERQTGGIGLRGGPGETQIELDRRMIGEAIKRTKERLTKVKKQRNTQRRQRERRDTFNISLVGYTNAGKSTLFNALVKARAYAADQLFATLDTTTRQLYLGEAGRSVSLSDTVGFIRDLPHGLVEAFQATLQEATEADLLLHVVDAANPDFPEQMAEVQKVLAEIGADTVPQLLVFNKLDALDAERYPLQLQDSYELDGQPVPRVFVSAQSGKGLDLLRGALSEIVKAAMPPSVPEMEDPRDLNGEYPDEMA
jgi:GTP-binding protein HflX